jgi:ABC-type thiamin/hydroxymethylpyrimidine transport system permease subunit
VVEVAPDEGSAWKRFVGRHWGVFVIFVVACVLAIAGAVYVLWWFVGNAQSTGLVPVTPSLWTMESLVKFIHS